MRLITSVIVLGSTFAYAIVRYHIFKGVAWAEFPLYISNKAIALASVMFIALSYTLGSLAFFWPHLFERTLPARKFFGLFGFALAATHALISLLIFTPLYYPKFFEATGKLNLSGELSLLFGIISLILFSIVAVTSIPSIGKSLGREQWLFFQHIGYWGMLAIAGHVFVMGFSGWLNVSGWPGGLPPISLIAFTIATAALLLHTLVVIMRSPR